MLGAEAANTNDPEVTAVIGRPASGDADARKEWMVTAGMLLDDKERFGPPTPHADPLVAHDGDSVNFGDAPPTVTDVLEQFPVGPEMQPARQELDETLAAYR
jgi:hypothetical protein